MDKNNQLRNLRKNQKADTKGLLQKGDLVYIIPTNNFGFINYKEWDYNEKRWYYRTDKEGAKEPSEMVFVENERHYQLLRRIMKTKFGIGEMRFHLAYFIENN